MSSTVAARLDELAETHALDRAARRRLAVLLEELADQYAPTTVRDPRRAVEVHIADALDGLTLAAVRAAASIADLGSGAGIPGLVLAAALPATRVVLVESVARKAHYADRVAAAMGLDNVAVVPARAESWVEGRGACDVVTARALAALPVLVEYAAPLLALGGALVAWKSGPTLDEQADGDHAARIVGLSVGTRHDLAPRPGADRRSLFVYVKNTETPASYPRRPGVAQRRPLRP